MKRITILLVLLVGLTIDGISQNKSELDSRFACPNETRDTLFVITEMVNTMSTLWDEPHNRKDKPVIVSVKVLDPNVLKTSLNYK